MLWVFSVLQAYASGNIDPFAENFGRFAVLDVNLSSFLVLNGCYGENSVEKSLVEMDLKS